MADDDAIEQQADGQRFLEELGERVGCVEGFFDGSWWMTLQMMLSEGWKIIPPPPEGDGDDE